MTKRIHYPTARRAISLAAALVALALPASGASAAGGSSFGIRVINGDNGTVARFRSAKCGISKAFGFIALSHDAGYSLKVEVNPFSGFHRYALRRGHYTGTFITLRAPSGTTYASDYIPPYHVPGGGEINFSPNRRHMGGGFSNMFSADGSDAVVVAGVLKCNYPKKKRRGR